MYSGSKHDHKGIHRVLMRTLANVKPISVQNNEAKSDLSISIMHMDTSYLGLQQQIASCSAMPSIKELAPSVDTVFPSLSVSSRTANGAVSGSENKEWGKAEWTHTHTLSDAADYLLMMITHLHCLWSGHLKRWHTATAWNITHVRVGFSPLVMTAHKYTNALKDFNTRYLKILSNKFMTEIMMNNGTAARTPWQHLVLLENEENLSQLEAKCTFLKEKLVAHTMSHDFSANGHKNCHSMTSSTQLSML